MMAIAGPNGSGKSRLLRCIKEAIETPIKEDTLRASLEASSMKRIEILAEPLHPGLPAELAATRDEALERITQEAMQVDIQLMQLPKISMESPKRVKVLDLKTKRPDMLAVADAKMSDLAYAASMPGQISNFDDAMKNAKRRIFKISLDHIAASSEVVERGGVEADAKARYMDLDDLVSRLLREQLRHDIGNSVTLFGKALDEANLSDGQALLLQFAAALFDVQDFEPCVVLLDEPETHLHPGAQIMLLEALKRALPNGQIIMATHSVPLLAHIGVDNIWSMNKGRLSKSGKDVQEVLSGLMGNFDDIARMRDFIDEPERIAAVEFAKECLVAPLPAPYKQKDPQQDQMVDGLGELWPAGRRLTVIDWGAGKGRLATALREHLLDDKDHAKSGLDYFAFNPFCSQEDREACLGAMSLLDSAVTEIPTAQQLFPIARIQLRTGAIKSYNLVFC